MARLGAVLGAGVIVLVLGGCADGEAGPDTTPSGAVVLRENAPSDVGDARVVATEVDGDAATVRVSNGSSPSTPTEVTEGGVLSVGHSDFRVEAIWSEGDSGEPGGQGGRVMLVPTG